MKDNLTQSRKKMGLFSVYLTFFVDNLSWAIVFPIFPPFFFDPHNTLFQPDISLPFRMMILGWFLMAFSLGQFLGAPLIGEYADRNGRKKALMYSVLFTFIGLALTAWSMQEGNLILLFISRIITGVFASSSAVCLSCISDVSENHHSKVKNFGYFSVIAGLSFIIGAYVGGKLSDQTVNANFLPNFPVWLAAALTLINFLLVAIAFKETAQIHPEVKYHFFRSFYYIKVALETGKVKRFFLLFFLFIFAWTILFQFISVLTVAKFQFTSSSIGDLALYMGVCWAFGSGYLNKWMIRRFESRHVLGVCLIGFTCFSAFIILPNQVPGLIAVLGVCSILGGLAWPICISRISGLACNETQGKIMGASQSIQSLAMSLAPVLAGITFNFSLNLPFLLASAVTFIAAILYFSFQFHLKE